MTTLLFLCGMGVGSLLATILMIFILRMVVRGKSNAQLAADNYNERCLVALQERNVLAERHAAALEQIAKR